MEGRIRETKGKGSDFAIAFAKSFAADSLKDYVEPERAGTPKGDLIGFSVRKKRASYLMVLYPNCLTLKEISKEADVPPGVLRAWKIQPLFIKEWSQACDLLGERMINTIENAVMEKYFPIIPGLKEGLSKKTLLKIDLPKLYTDQGGIGVVMFLADMFPFLNSQVVVPVIRWIQKQIGPNECGSEEYRGLLFRILRNLNARSAPKLRVWFRNPEVLELQKRYIADSIDFLINPGMLEQPREKLEELALVLKNSIFQIIDNLAS